MAILLNKDLFYIERMGFKFTGVVLSDSSNFLYQIYSITVIFGCMTIYTLLLFLDLFKKDLNDVLDSWKTFVSYFGALLLVGTTNYNWTQINNFLNKLCQAPFVPQKTNRTNVKLTLVQRWHRFKNMQALAFFIITILSVGSQMVYSVVLRLTKSDPTDWKLGYGVISIVDIRSSPNFEMVYLYQTISIVYGVTYLVMFTVMTTGIFNFIATQFKVLQNNLKVLLINAEKNLKKNQNKNMWNCLNEEIKDIVNYHQQIISLIKELENIFSLPVLIVFMIILIVNCFEIYQAYLLPIGDIRTVRVLIEGLAASFPSLLISNAGENMANESEKVAMVAYEINFVGTDLRFQKSLIIIIQQTQKSVTIKAGKFIHVSLISFAMLLRSSYSIYAVLRNFNENKS